MNSTTRIICAIGIVVLSSSATVHAQKWSDNLYLHTDIGPAFVESASARIRTVTTSSFPDATIQRGHTESETDIRADLSLGYNLTKSFAVEAEAGAIWNPNDDKNNYSYQIPVMLNGIYQIPLGASWKAYAGAGAGAVIGRAHTLFRDSAFHTPLVFDDSDWSAGYQAEAGIKYALSQHAEIDLGYKFMGVAQYDYTFINFFAFGSRKVTVNDLFTHSVQASFTWKF